MDHAILVAAGMGVDEEKLGSFGRTVIGGIPQLKRLIITAERAGIRRFTIITEKDDFSLKEEIENDKRIKSEIVWHPLGSPIKFDPTPSIILQSNLVINPAGLSNLMDCDVSEDEIMVLVDENKDAWVKTKGEIIEDIFSNGGKMVGAFVAYGSLLEKSILNSMYLKSWVKELVGRERVKFVRFSNGYWMRLSSDERSVKKAEDLIFSYVGKTDTGWISRNINSKISIPTSRLLVRTPLTPNMISVMINIIGMLSGPFYALGHPVLGALFLQIATILDRCDGEVARVKLMETKRGQWVDTICDQFTVLSFIIGVPVGYYLITKNPIIIVLGSLSVGIFIFFVIWSFYFLVKYTNSGSLVAYYNVDKLIGEENRSFVHKLIGIIRPMARRNFSSLAFLIVAIIGGYPWVLGILCTVSVLFLIHQTEDIIKLRKLRPPSNPLK
jgi:CDP-L-myo-inositol myo-inositolphosphotransferase